MPDNLPTSSSRPTLLGVCNIVRFNYGYFLLAFCVIVAFLCVPHFVSSSILITLSYAVAIVAFLGTLTPLIVSWWVYDHSPLYKCLWLDGLLPCPPTRGLNIHAGFDETSQLFKQKYPLASLDVLDFYDPESHTERSIKRARRKQPAFPETKRVSTQSLNLAPRYYNTIFLILAVHEIRDAEERRGFLLQLEHALAPEGKLVVVEHLRDVANFMAYSIGFFHFLSRSSLLKSFTEAHLQVVKEQKLTPFLRIFLLQSS